MLNWVEILQLGIIFIISISIHEFAHAWMSNRLGDPTPKLQGRLSLNPLAHIDPLGFILVFLIRFGRGKPVQINPGYYKNKRIGEFKVAIAGPLSNLFLAIIGISCMILINKFSGQGMNSFFTGNYLDSYLNPLISFLIQFSYINISLMVFNLLPIPPLDGFTLIKLININYAEKILKYQKYIFIGFLIFVYSGPFGEFMSIVCSIILKFLITILVSIIYLV